MTLKQVQDEGGPLWFEIQAAITEAAASAKTKQEEAEALLVTKDTEAKAVASKLASVVDEIRAAVVDISTPTDEAVLAILQEVTKEDRQKAIEEATRKRDEAQAELDKLQSESLEVEAVKK